MIRLLRNSNCPSKFEFLGDPETASTQQNPPQSQRWTINLQRQRLREGHSSVRALTSAISPTLYTSAFFQHRILKRFQFNKKPSNFRLRSLPLSLSLSVPYTFCAHLWRRELARLWISKKIKRRCARGTRYRRKEVRAECNEGEKKNRGQAEKVEARWGSQKRAASRGKNELGSFATYTHACIQSLAYTYIPTSRQQHIW